MASLEECSHALWELHLQLFPAPPPPTVMPPSRPASKCQADADMEPVVLSPLSAHDVLGNSDLFSRTSSCVTIELDGDFEMA